MSLTPTNAIEKITTGLIYRSLGMDSVHDVAINQKGHIMICIVQMEKLRLVGVRGLNNYALVVCLQQTRHKL